MSDINIVCLDLEGVLVPEIWIAFAEKVGVEEFKKTTRDDRKRGDSREDEKKGKRKECG